MGDRSKGRYLAVACKWCFNPLPCPPDSLRAIAFDVHLGETFVPIALGMPLFSAPRSDLLESLPYYVNLLGITHVGIVPSLIEATLNAASDEDGKTELRYIASGGEKMSDAVSPLLDQWNAQILIACRYWTSGRITPRFAWPTSMGQAKLPSVVVQDIWTHLLLERTLAVLLRMYLDMYGFHSSP